MFFILFFIIVGYYNNAIILNKNYISNKILRIFIPILLLLFGISSVRVLTIFIIPIVIFNSVSILKITKFNIIQLIRKINLELYIWIFVSIIGLLITKIFITPRNFGPLNYFSIASIRPLESILNDIFGNIGRTIAYSFLAINPIKQPITIFSIFIFIFFIFILFYFRKIFPNISSESKKFFLLIAISLTITFLTAIISKLGQRYLFLHGIILPFATVLVYDYCCKNNKILLRFIVAYGAIIASFFSCVVNFNALNCISFNYKGLNKYYSQTIEQIDPITNYYLSNGVRYIYGTYYNSLDLTIATDYNIIASPLHEDLSNYLWGVSAKNYTQNLSMQKSGLILSEDELNDLIKSNNAKFDIIKQNLLNVKKIQTSQGNLYLYVLKINPFADININN
jgi:hypothetical protein